MSWRMVRSEQDECRSGRSGRPSGSNRSRRQWRRERFEQAWCSGGKSFGLQGAPIQNKRAAEKLEHELREELLNADDRKAVTAVAPPLFADFAREFIDTYAATNNKPSEIESKRMILRVHLVPQFGDLRLDEIGVAEIDAYKAKKLAAKIAPKTINNHSRSFAKCLASRSSGNA